MLAAVIVVPLLLAPGAAGAGPSITAIITGTLGTNGWYRSNVTVNWQIQPLPVSSSGCDAVTLTTDTPGTTLTCSASWSDGTSITVKRVFKIDRSPPAISVAADRAPDANGWYNHPLTIVFSGTDAISGVASCSRIQYAGPDTPGTNVGGRCTDRAGNTGTAGFPLRYDATPPRLVSVKVAHGNHTVTLRWVASGGVLLSEVRRSPAPRRAKSSTLYRGRKFQVSDRRVRPGKTYLYAITVWDQAANSAFKSMPVVGTGPLTTPVPGAHVSSPPRLAWTPVQHADFYNVQLFRSGKVLSAWPVHAHLALGWKWRFQRHRFRLMRGTYSWYVWPGFRRGTTVRYGPLLGHSSFVVRR
jgi:hypothetical protein